MVASRRPCQPGDHGFNFTWGKTNLETLKNKLGSNLFDLPKFGTSKEVLGKLR